VSDTPWLVSAVDTAANVVHDEATRGGGVVGPMGVADLAALGGALTDLLDRLATWTGLSALGVAVLGEGHRRRTWFPPPHGWAPYRLTTPRVITHGRRRHIVSLSTRTGGRDGRRACGAGSATRRARRTCRPTVSKWSAGTCTPGRRAGQDFVDVEADGAGSTVAARRANSSRLYSTSPRS